MLVNINIYLFVFVKILYDDIANILVDFTQF